MTLEEFQTRIDELVDEDMLKYIKEECTRLAKSGAVDLDKYENNFRLPKTVLAACFASKLSWAYRPMPWDKKELKVFRNLQKF